MVPVRDCIKEVGDPRVISGELVRGLLTSLGECVSSRLYWRVEDPRSTFGKLVRGLLESLEEYIIPRLHWRMGDLRLTPGELVRDPLASPRECVSPKLHWRMRDLRSTLDDCRDIALRRASQFPSKRVAKSPLLEIYS
jgi:hypothetical protein